MLELWRASENQFAVQPKRIESLLLGMMMTAGKRTRKGLGRGIRDRALGHFEGDNAQEFSDPPPGSTDRDRPGTG
jgi:hypothetical protein